MMDTVSVKRRKKEYIFSPQEIVIKKNGEVIRIVNYNEIKWITYNPKFGLVDLLMLIIAKGQPMVFFPKTFVIMIPYPDDKRGFVFMKMSKDDFEKVKNVVPMTIEIM